MHIKTTHTASISERPSPSHPPSHLFTHTTPLPSSTPQKISIHPHSPVIPIRRRVVVPSWFSPSSLNSQITNLTLYAKPIPKKASKGWPQPEDLRRIRHFSNSNLSIFKQYRTSRAKNMNIFPQIRTFSPTSDHWPLTTGHSNLTFHANPLPRIRAHSRTQLPNIRSSAGSATVQPALIPTFYYKLQPRFYPLKAVSLRQMAKYPSKSGNFSYPKPPNSGTLMAFLKLAAFAVTHFFCAGYPPWPPVAAPHRSALPLPKNPNAQPRFPEVQSDMRVFDEQP
jgi:hypothetical protein